MTSEPVKKIKEKLVTETDDFGRKKFTLQAVDEQNEGQKQQKGHALIQTGRYKSALIGRDEKIDTNKYIGRLQTNKKNRKTEVFYCEICKLGFKCDLAYISHINTPAHNRKIGMNMKVLAVSKQTVAQKLRRMHKQKRQQIGKKQAKVYKILEKNNVKYQEQNEQAAPSQNSQRSEEDKQNLKKQQELEPKIENDQKDNEVESQEEVNEEEQMMNQCLGFSGFGNKKKKY